MASASFCRCRIRELRSQRVRDLARFSGQVLQADVGFGGRRFGDPVSDFLDVAVEIGCRRDRFFEGFRGSLEGGPEGVNALQGRLGRGPEDGFSSADVSLAARALNSIEKGAPILQGRSRTARRDSVNFRAGSSEPGYNAVGENTIL